MNFDSEFNIEYNDKQVLATASALFLCVFMYINSIYNKTKSFINKHPDGVKSVPKILEEYTNEYCSKNVNRQTTKLLYKTTCGVSGGLFRYNLDTLSVCVLTDVPIPLEERDPRVYYTLNWIDALRWLNRNETYETCDINQLD